MTFTQIAASYEPKECHFFAAEYKIPISFLEEVIKRFKEKFGKVNVSDIDRDQLKEFTDDNFDHIGSELEKCDLDGWTSEPERIMKIEDKVLRDWALVLNDKWRKLCRKVSSLKQNFKQIGYLCRAMMKKATKGTVLKTNQIKFFIGAESNSPIAHDTKKAIENYAARAKFILKVRKKKPLLILTK